MINENIQEMIDDMRNITMLTGQISIVQEKTIKTWPSVAYDDVVGVEIKYDLTKDYVKENGEGYVKYYINTKNIPEDAEKRSKFLAHWIRDLFWKEIKIEVYLNEKCILEDSSKED